MVGDNIIKAMIVIEVNSLRFVPNIIIGGKSLVLGLQFDIIGEPENATQRDINLVPSSLIDAGNVFGLFGQVVVTNLTLEPQLDNSSPRAVVTCPN